MSEPHQPVLNRTNGLMDRVMLLAWVVRVLMGCAGTLLFVLPRLLTQEGITETTAGWIMASYQMAMLIAMVVGGEMLHKRGTRFTLLVGGLCALAGCATYLLGSRHPAFYFLARALHGTGAGLVALTLQGMVMMRAERGARGRAMGLANLPDFLMMSVSPLLAEALSAAQWTRGIYILAAVICFAPLCAASMMPRTGDSATPPSLIHAPFGWNHLEWAGMAFSFVGGFAIQFAMFSVPLVTKQTGGWGFSLFFLAYGLTAISGRILIEPRLHGRRSPIALLAFAFLTPTAIVGMSLAHHSWVFALLGACGGLGHGMYYPSLVQVMTQHIPGHRLMVRVGRLQSVAQFGSMLASPAAGVLIRHLDQTYALLIGAAVIIPGMATIMILIHRNLHHLEREDSRAASDLGPPI